mmetsp:Transcript_12266/g.49231  ORF Transcript_12266/g.49231 Transcript_12266/m.49231 type:complete len:220 (-) Transcript_12266:172-831(-)
MASSRALRLASCCLLITSWLSSNLNLWLHRISFSHMILSFSLPPNSWTMMLKMRLFVFHGLNRVSSTSTAPLRARPRVALSPPSKSSSRFSTVRSSSSTAGRSWLTMLCASSTESGRFLGSGTARPSASGLTSSLPALLLCLSGFGAIAAPPDELERAWVDSARRAGAALRVLPGVVGEMRTCGELARRPWLLAARAGAARAGAALRFATTIVAGLPGR